MTSLWSIENPSHLKVNLLKYYKYIFYYLVLYFVFFSKIFVKVRLTCRDSSCLSKFTNKKDGVNMNMQLQGYFWWFGHHPQHNDTWKEVRQVWWKDWQRQKGRKDKREEGQRWSTNQSKFNFKKWTTGSTVFNFNSQCSAVQLNHDHRDLHA